MTGALGVQLFKIGGQLLAQLVGILLAGLLVNRGHDVGGEVQTSSFG